MKFNKNAFLYISMGMMTIISLYYAYVSRNQPNSLFTYLALALLFGAGTYNFRKKVYFTDEDPNKIEKKDRKRKSKKRVSKEVV
ncbi:MAG TPA: hypothetical protein GX703_06805 [Erysipelothrix sp.]|jgi:hypothetical protein|nr:hypothetical protein [Erysipelothrix sp.]